MAKAYLGYNFCGPVGGDVIPQRLQNLCIRDYAQSQKITVSFSASEYFDSKPSLMLFSILENMGDIEGFVFFSILLLPAEKDRRHEFFKKVVAEKKPVHFALENLSMHDQASCKRIARIYQIGVDDRLGQNRDALLDLRKIWQN